MAIDRAALIRIVRRVDYPADGSEIEKAIRQNFMSDETLQVGQQLASHGQLFRAYDEAVRAVDSIIASDGLDLRTA